MTINEAMDERKTSHRPQERKETASQRGIRQAICRVCGKPARAGTAIVIHFGAGGRVHKTCAKGNPADP